MPRVKKITEEVAIARGARLVFARKIAGVSRKELVIGTPYADNAVYRWEEGKYQGINEKSAQLLVQRLRECGVICSANWMLYGTGEPPCREDAPKGAALDSLSETDYWMLPNNVKAQVELFKQLYPASLIYVVPDDSMKPYFSKGDCVGAVECKDFRNTAAHRLCVVQVKNENSPRLLRRVEYGRRVGTFDLLCEKPLEGQMPLESVTIESAALVIWWAKAVF